MWEVDICMVAVRSEELQTRALPRVLRTVTRAFQCRECGSANAAGKSTRTARGWRGKGSLLYAYAMVRRHWNNRHDRKRQRKDV